MKIASIDEEVSFIRDNTGSTITKSINIEAGKVILGWNKPNGGDLDREDGDLINFIFNISSAAMGSTNLTFGAEEVLDINFSEVETEFVSGDITIETTSTFIKRDIKVTVYPNPFSTYVMIDVSSLNNIEKIEIRDVQERKISELSDITGEIVELSEPMFRGSGVYLVAIVTSDKTCYKRIVKTE